MLEKFAFLSWVVTRPPLMVLSHMVLSRLVYRYVSRIMGSKLKRDHRITCVLTPSALSAICEQLVPSALEQ
jgi:hypothetical protein